jgi:hypothetical protein
MGFGSPLEKWMRAELKDMFSHYMSDDFVAKQNVFQPQRIAEIREAFLSGRPISFDRVAFIFLFQMWWEKWMK